MTQRRHQLTALTIAALALTAAAGVPRGTPDPINAGAMATVISVTLGVPTNGSDPVSAPAIFEDPFGG